VTAINAFASESAPATKTVLFGRFMLPDMSEHPCQVLNLSADGATFISAEVPQGGQQIVAYVDDVGRIEAISAEPVAGGFKVVFPLKGPRRERLEQRLRMLADKDGESGVENRRHARVQLTDSKSHITLPDGRIYPCEVHDISLSGAAVKVSVLPSLGTHVMLGRMRGRVVRYLDTGIAIEFIKQLDRPNFAENLR
jgi:hypothetical protein